MRIEHAVSGDVLESLTLFGSSECENCQALKMALSKAGVPFRYVNALDEDPKVQAECDEFEVDDMPHIEVVWNGRHERFAGAKPCAALMSKLKVIS